MEQQIAYEPHPVTPERKAELRAKGLQIIDVIFKPEEAPIIDGGEGVAIPPDGALSPPLVGDGSGEALPVIAASKAELQAALDAKGIAHKPAMSKAELQAMLDGGA